VWLSWVADGWTGWQANRVGSGRAHSVLVGPKKGYCSMLCGGAADCHLVSRGGASSSVMLQPCLHNRQFFYCVAVVALLDSEDEGATVLQNIRDSLASDTASHLRRPELSAILL
jgi:hypothetical protein